MTAFLIGAAIGAAITVIGMCVGFKIQSTESYLAEQAKWSGMANCYIKLTEEASKLRVALASGEMTEEAKKVVALTMAALGVTEQPSTEPSELPG